MKNKSLKQIASALDITCSSDCLVKGFAIDSRLVKAGDLFFAIGGNRADGHSFLSEVAKKGAVGAVVQKSYSGPDFGLELLRVEDVRAAIQTLAFLSFAKRKEPVIAITGSMGKTTTKEFLATLLSVKFRIGKSEKSYNSQLTLPLTLLNLENDPYDFIVLEMAMSNHGHIRRLVELAPPDIALVTQIAPAGMENFEGGLSAIASAKGEIFSHPKTKLGFISKQAAEFKEILDEGDFPKFIYGGKDFYFEGECIRENGILSPPLKTVFDAAHLRENFLGAAAVARHLGLTWEEIQKGALQLKPVERRFEKIVRGDITFIQDCYNANPHSVCAALTNLPKPQGGKVIGVLGYMPDLGPASEKYHKEVGEFAREKLDLLLTVGKDAKVLNKAYGKKGEHFEDVPSLKKALFEQVSSGDVVLIKGSNLLQLWKLLED